MIRIGIEWTVSSSATAITFQQKRFLPIWRATPTPQNRGMHDGRAVPFWYKCMALAGTKDEGCGLNFSGAHFIIAFISLFSANFISQMSAEPSSLRANFSALWNSFEWQWVSNDLRFEPCLAFISTVLEMSATLEMKWVPKWSEHQNEANSWRF